MLEKLEAGDPIRESWVSDLVDTVNRAGLDPQGNYSPYGEDGASHGFIQNARKPTTTQVAVARMKEDIIPRRWQENTWGNGQVKDPIEFGENIGDPNAVIQVWDEALETWSDDSDRYITVIASHDLPLKKDDVVHVVYNSDAGAWFPAFTPLSAMVEITDAEPDDDGFMDGIVKLWDSDTNKWYDGPQIWIVDANRD